MMIKFNSLKAKIIALLTITSLTIAFVLFYIFINFYKKDKIAYIFDTNSSNLESAGDQFRREVEFTGELVKVHLDNIKKNKKLSLSSEEFLSPNYYLESIGIYQTNPYKVIDQLRKKDSLEISEADLNKFNKNEDANNDQNIFINDTRVTVHSQLLKNNQSWAVVYQFDSATLKDYFKNGEVSNLALIDKIHGVSKHAYQNLEASRADVINKELVNTSSDLFKQNSSTQNIDLVGKKYLFSSAKLYQSSSYLSSFISQDKALENLKSLLIKAAFFFIFISALVVLLSYFASHYLTHRLKKLTISAERIAAGQFDEKIEDSGTDEISTLTNGFNQMSIEISRLLSETANKARMESELKTAQLVQATLFPKNIYESDFIQIQGYYMSASECGGDWWHYFESNDKVWVWIADATGHGAGAALLTSAAKSAVSIIEKLNLPIKESFELLNFAICNVSKENMMMTSFVGVIDKTNLNFKYVNASHEPSILIRKSDIISKDDLVYLNESTNPRLGQSKDSLFESNEIQLQHGDRVMFYTDGVTDIRSPEHKVFGERGLIKSIVKSHNNTKNLVDFYSDYEQNLNAFRSNTELIDDVTYCFFEIK